MRRLLLASVVGIISSSSSSSSVLGLLICLVFIFVFVELKPFKEMKDSILGIILAYALTLFFLVAILLSNGAISQHGSFAQALGILLTVIIITGPVFVVSMLVKDYYLSLEANNTEAQMQFESNSANSTDTADHPTPIQDTEMTQQTFRHHKRASEALMKKTLGKAGLKSDLASGLNLTQVIEMVDPSNSDVQANSKTGSIDVEGGSNDVSPTSIVSPASNVQPQSFTGVSAAFTSWLPTGPLSKAHSTAIGSTI